MYAIIFGLYLDLCNMRTLQNKYLILYHHIILSVPVSWGLLLAIPLLVKALSSTAFGFLLSAALRIGTCRTQDSQILVYYTTGVLCTTVYKTNLH